MGCSRWQGPNPQLVLTHPLSSSPFQKAPGLSGYVCLCVSFKCAAHHHQDLKTTNHVFLPCTVPHCWIGSLSVLGILKPRMIRIFLKDKLNKKKKNIADLNQFFIYLFWLLLLAFDVLVLFCGRIWLCTLGWPQTHKDPLTSAKFFMANSQAKILPLLPLLRKGFKGLLEGNTLLWKCQSHSGVNSLHTSLECGEAPSHWRLVPRPTSHGSRIEINLLYTWKH